MGHWTQQWNNFLLIEFCIVYQALGIALRLQPPNVLVHCSNLSAERFFFSMKTNFLIIMCLWNTRGITATYHSKDQYTSLGIGIYQRSMGSPQATSGPLASCLWPPNCYSFTVCFGWVSTCTLGLVSMPTIHRNLGHSLLRAQLLTFTYVFGAVHVFTFC